MSLPRSWGGGDASDKACTFWATSLIPYTSPEFPDLSQHGTQVFTALLRAFLFGFSLSRAVEHKIRVWRTTPEGKEMISDSRSVSDDSVRLVDMRNIISGTDEEGRTLEPQDDMITTLFDVINMAEIESAQRAKETDEVSADGSDNDDNASQCSAGSRREEPHPGYRVEAKLPDNATPDEVAQAAAKTAADVREWNRQRGRVDDETLIFPPTTLEEAGAGSRVGPASYSVMDSVHDSDFASLCPKSEVTRLTSGALAQLPELSLRKTSGSETSLHSEKGWEATERPPAIARSEPEQQILIFQHMKTMPEFLTAPLAAEGPNFFRPDASTGGAHFES